MNKKMTTLEYLKKTGCTDFGIAFARAAGSIGMDAESNPDASYSVADVRDLMDYLFALQVSDILGGDGHGASDMQELPVEE